MVYTGITQRKVEVSNPLEGSPPVTVFKTVCAQPTTHTFQVQLSSSTVTATDRLKHPFFHEYTLSEERTGFEPVRQGLPAYRLSRAAP